MAKSENFKEKVEKAMAELVEANQTHEIYKPTKIEKSIIDEENKIAAFVLSKQIDKCHPDGDEFEYSLWHVSEGEKPKLLYKDSGWIRGGYEPSYSITMGYIHPTRNPYIGLEKVLKDGVIATITPEKGCSPGIRPEIFQTKVKITLDGKIQELGNFIEQAQNLIKKIGPKIKYDYLKQTKELGENVAAFVWTAEDGYEYGFDTVYVVWKDKAGKLKYRTVTDSSEDKAYLTITGVKKEGKDIILEVKGKGKTSSYKVDIEE